MNPRARQLALDWPPSPSFALDDFLPRPGNRQALEMILAWPDWPKPVLLLSGPEASGKTHLAEVWRCMAQAEKCSLLAEASDAPLVIEEAERVAAKGETGFFHFLNARLAGGPALLLTSRLAPGHWRLGLPDLASRIRALPHAPLAAIDDALLQAMMIKIVREHHADVKPQAVLYVLRRIERSPAAVRQAARLLHAAAAERGRSVSLALARALFP